MSRCPCNALTWVLKGPKVQQDLAVSGCYAISGHSGNSPGIEVPQWNLPDGKGPFVNHVIGEIREETAPVGETTLERKDHRLLERRNVKQGQKLEVIFSLMFKKQLEPELPTQGWPVHSGAFSVSQVWCQERCSQNYWICAKLRLGYSDSLEGKF